MKFVACFLLVLWLLLFIPGVIGLFAATEVAIGLRIAYVLLSFGVLVPPFLAWLNCR